MKGNLKLSGESVGQTVRVRAIDGFELEGVVRSVTESSMEVRDNRSRNTFTLFAFEIDEMAIVKGGDTAGGDARMSGSGEGHEEDKTCVSGDGAGPRRMLDRGVFRRPESGHDNESGIDKGRAGRRLRFTDLTQTLTGSDLRPTRNDLSDCRFVIAGDACPGTTYDMVMSHLEQASTVGVWVTRDGPEGQEGGCVAVSSGVVTLIERVEQCGGRQWRWSGAGSHGQSRLRELLTRQEVSGNESSSQVRVVCGARLMNYLARRALGLELTGISGPLCDLVVFQHGIASLHSAAVCLSAAAPRYFDLVRDSFQFETPRHNIVSDNDSFREAPHQALFRTAAFSAHFLVPLYQKMVRRLLEPMWLISERVSRLNDDSLDDTDELFDNYDNYDIDLDVLPRSVQFWTYRDNSSALQAKRVTDIELQFEKQARGNSNGGGGTDVVEINKNIVKAQEMANKPNKNYYEEISDDESADDDKARHGRWMESRKKEEPEINKIADLEETRRRKMLEEQENQRLLSEAKIAEELERKRKAEEMEERRRIMAENQRLISAAKIAEELERKRKAEEMEERRRISAENQRLLSEAKIAEELERKRKAEEMARAMAEMQQNQRFMKDSMKKQAAVDHWKRQNKVALDAIRRVRSQISSTPKDVTNPSPAETIQPPSVKEPTKGFQKETNQSVEKETNSYTPKLGVGRGRGLSRASTRNMTVSPATASEPKINKMQEKGPCSPGEVTNGTPRIANDQKTSNIYAARDATSTRSESSEAPSIERVRGADTNSRTPPSMPRHPGFTEVSLTGPESLDSNRTSDRILTRGRGSSERPRTSLSRRTGTTGNDNSPHTPFTDSSQCDLALDESEFCELSTKHWSRNRHTATDKLCLEHFEEIDSLSAKPAVANQAMGIMWNAIGNSRDQETDDLYREYGL